MRKSIYIAALLANVVALICVFNPWFKDWVGQGIVFSGCGSGFRGFRRGGRYSCITCAKGCRRVRRWPQASIR